MARHGDNRSPSPVGSSYSSKRNRREDDRYDRSRREDGRGYRNRSRTRSPDVCHTKVHKEAADADRFDKQRRYRDRDSRSHRNRSRDRREDDSYRSGRRDRSRDRRRSRDRDAIRVRIFEFYFPLLYLSYTRVLSVYCEAQSISMMLI